MDNQAPAGELTVLHYLPHRFSTSVICSWLSVLVHTSSAADVGDIDVFDAATSKKIHEEHQRDMEDAAKAIGESKE